jgi:hypothetical protein
VNVSLRTVIDAYWLGGTDNFAGDREAGEQYRRIFPGVAQRIAPDSRVVYVDNDPMVLAHARSLLSDAGADRADPERRAGTRRGHRAGPVPRPPVARTAAVGQPPVVERPWTSTPSAA